jgi:4-hydroxy-tetrahydrodipicolinate reductase
MSFTIGVHGASGKLGSLILNNTTNAVAIPKRGKLPDCNVIIDVTSAQGTTHLLPRLSNQPLLIGTTGELPWNKIEEYAKNAPVAVVPNFSVGVPLLIELVQTAIKALPNGWDIEVMEVHHNQKKDAPSGTAKRIISAIEDCGFADIPTHALRVGDTFGEHTVWLCGPGERLELKHVATGRTVFAVGAIRWAKWLIEQPNGFIRP